MPRKAFFPITVLAIFWIARVVHISTSMSYVLIVASWLGVLVHELGHAAVIVLTGGKLRSVIPTPFMGMTRFDRDGPPRHEFALALAGPVAGALFALAGLGAMRMIALPPTESFRALHLVLWAGVADNLLFNMIPLGTLDGAWAMRALEDQRLARVFHRQAERELEAAWQSARRSRTGTTVAGPTTRPAPRAHAIALAATGRRPSSSPTHSSAAHHEAHVMAMRARRARAARRGDAEI